MMVLPRKSSIVLWLVAVPLLALSVIRPPNLRNDRAARFPTKLAGYTLVSKNKVGKRHFQLLGTRDVAWWNYRDENGKKYVEVEQKATTHRGELSAFGTSVAELPSKG